MRGYTSTPQYAFMAWCLVKHRDNFTFTFFYLWISEVSPRSDTLRSRCRICSWSLNFLPSITWCRTTEMKTLGSNVDC